MLEIRLTLEQIDYDSAIDVLFPYISDILAQSLADTNPLARLLGRAITKTEAINKDLIKGVFLRLPDDKKEELLLWCVNNRADAIERLLEREIGKSGIAVRLDDLHIKQSRD